MKEMYQQAVADSEKVTKINAVEEIQHATNARSIKERFERGEPIAAGSDDEQDGMKNKTSDKPDEEILAAGTCGFNFDDLEKYNEKLSSMKNLSSKLKRKKYIKKNFFFHLQFDSYIVKKYFIIIFQFRLKNKSIKIMTYTLRKEIQ